MSEVAEQAASAVKERLTGPLGYITISFIIYNWAWFYFIIFSELPAESKIASVINFFPRHSGFGVPLLVGSILTIFMPFLIAWINRITTKARTLKNETDILEKNSSEILLAGLKADVVNKNYEITLKTTAVEELKNQRASLSDEVKKYQEMLDKLHLDEATIRNSIISARQEKDNLDFSIAKNTISFDTNEKLKSELESKNDWLENQKNAVIVLSEQNEYIRKKLIIALVILKRKDIWQDSLTEDDKLKLYDIISEMGLN